MIVGTSVEKGRAGHIELDRMLPYTTKLLAAYSGRSGRWGDFEPFFPQERDASYCHLFLSDEAGLLLFASDAPGGYGGFDIYLSCWDYELERWGDPVNLGPEINTEGDELFPSYADGRIFFSSNGLPGAGGFDLYSCAYDADYGELLPGTVTRLAAPLNSAYNDFCLFGVGADWGYFVSDRNISTGDDLYAYRLSDGPGGAGTYAVTLSPFFGMSESEAILGGQLLVSGMLEEESGSSAPQHRDFPPYAPKMHVLTLFFDFDSLRLTPESVRALERYFDESGQYDILSFRILGYADEMGSDEYNMELSRRRSEEVAAYLKRRFDVPMESVGCGRTKLGPDDMLPDVARSDSNYVLSDSALSDYTPSLDYAARIRRNAPARRVEVYVNE